MEVVEAVRRAENRNRHSRRIVLLVTLDVRNAFNSANWNDVLTALEKSFHIPKYLLRMIDDYVRNRVLIYETKEGYRRKTITSGAAQGSILGPDLWNASYDGLLRTNMPEETVLVGYADDVAALIAARDMEMAQIKLRSVMLTINNWMTNHGLSLALMKTGIVVLTKSRINTVLPFHVGGEIVTSKPAVKYLGITIDNKMTFWEQIKMTAGKAAKGVTALSRLIANTSRPKSSKRRLLMSTVQSVLLYGAEFWAVVALSKEKYRKRLAQVQRQAALRVASSYRTVSEPAVLVIAGIAPIALLARERYAIYQRKTELNQKEVKKEEINRTYEAWQRLWEQESRGRWTARLIKSVKTWTQREHGEINYYLTQFLSGHGYFLSYLEKMRKVTSPVCLYCEGYDDAEHTFFTCERWSVYRRNIEEEIEGQLSPHNIVQKMHQSPENWNRISRYVEKILREKKSDLDNR